MRRDLGPPTCLTDATPIVAKDQVALVRERSSELTHHGNARDAAVSIRRARAADQDHCRKTHPSDRRWFRQRSRAAETVGWYRHVGVGWVAGVAGTRTHA